MITTTLRKDVLEKYMSSYFFETGTADGDAVRLAIEMGFEKIYSIEIDERLYIQNCEKFKKFIESGQVVLILGDSLLKMEEIIPQLDKPTTFWLDAHVDFGPKGVKRCPLYEELESIKTSNINNHKIMIDDMRIFGKHWGIGISEETLKKTLLEINPKYTITIEDGYVLKDVLCAKI
jgi:hypothetical protein